VIPRSGLRWWPAGTLGQSGYRNPDRNTPATSRCIR